jgi:hypothetical protein
MLVGKNVLKNDLTKPDELEIVRKSASHLTKNPKNSYRLEVSELCKKRFREFLENLAESNNSNIYIWTDKSNYCGLLKVKSLLNIKYEYIYDAITEGVIVFLTDDFIDRLLIDFDEKYATVEIQGKNWSKIQY